MSLTPKGAPIRAIHQELCGIHRYDREPGRQVIAYHFCAHISEDMHQCVIYDSNRSDAKLIGIEYIITRKLFEQLPEEEKKYWHSHVHEVKSGVLVAPGIPEPLERAALEKLIDTYGKTWHTWQIDAHPHLPLGPPKLMLSLTQDMKAKPELVAKKDEQTGINTESRREKRQDMRSPEIARGADVGLRKDDLLGKL
eukprot:TRINITY_DN35544_c0_g2_i3.p1 TRINITY_DN35544_c0_g2~~TRINITY_DN35544_c0_g2_i3.p1  ORF type:complete len:196 (+),score=10.76 TRINITY_DN35544_c0_g2_i3:98-685(+)